MKLDRKEQWERRKADEGLVKVCTWVPDRKRNELLRIAKQMRKRNEKK